MTTRKRHSITAKIQAYQKTHPNKPSYSVSVEYPSHLYWDGKTEAKITRVVGSRCDGSGMGLGKGPNYRDLSWDRTALRHAQNIRAKLLKAGYKRVKVTFYDANWEAFKVAPDGTMKRIPRRIK